MKRNDSIARIFSFSFFSSYLIPDRENHGYTVYDGGNGI